MDDAEGTFAHDSCILPHGPARLWDNARVRRGPWHGWLNAEIYAGFTDRHSLYAELNRTLVEAADVSRAKRILDLACGTGATTRVLLTQIGPTSEIVALDASEPMVEVARTRIRDARVSFHVVGAGSLGEVLEGEFDRVVCNAAFWQFPAPRPVLEAVGRCLVPAGRFAFNVPAERVMGFDGAAVHGFQASLARAIEDVAGRRMSEPPVVLDPARLSDWAEEVDLRLCWTTTAWQGRQSELMELMEIPAMIEPLTPGLDAATRAEILRIARRRIDPDERVTVPWVLFLAERPDD